MKYFLVYYGYSKYYGCNRKHYLEFNNIINVIKYIKDNKLKKFTIYEKCDIVDVEDIEEEING